MGCELRFWDGRDNAEEVVLLRGASPVPLAAVQRVVVVVAGQTLDSDDQEHAQLFEWPVAATWASRSAEAIRLRLGGAGLPAGRHGASRLITYDPEHQEGVVWDDALVVDIRA